MAVEPFRMRVSDRELEDLRVRISATRWPPELPGRPWQYGTDHAYLRSLADHWLESFDWRAQERRLDALPQFLVDLDGSRVHVIHARASAPDSIPLLLLHGWPGSVVQLERIIPLLAEGAGGVAFDVVAPSLPGFGYSSPLADASANETTIAETLHRLMTDELGYDRYLVRGSDFGQGVLDALVDRHPDAIIGAHISGTSAVATDTPTDASPEIREYLDAVRRWRRSESGYAVLQSTRPDSLSPALHDSPTGLAAWLVEKYRSWSDCDGEVERRFSKDDLLANVSFYWFTASIASSIRLYAAPAPDVDLRSSRVPIAFLVSTKDMVPTPREWFERSYRVARWTGIDRGGHFLDWEEPEIVAEDLRGFVRQLGVSDSGRRSASG